MTLNEGNTERARAIGTLAGKINYLKGLHNKGDIGGLGDFSSVYDNMTAQVLADMQKEVETLRKILVEGGN